MPRVPILLPHLPPGTHATVVAVAAESVTLLDDVGVTVGAHIAVERVVPLGGPLVARLGAARVALGRRVALDVQVLPAATGPDPS